jgi:hypothetical protein
MGVKGRKKGSGIWSQLRIVSCLTTGPKASSEIRQLTRLNKNTVCYNIQILAAIRALSAKRMGRKIMYELDTLPFFKLLLLHAAIGNRWALKIIRATRRMFSSLPKVMQPIRQMYRLIWRYYPLYERTKRRFPELELEKKDVWDAAWWIKQFEFDERAVKHKTHSATHFLKGEYSREEFKKRRQEFMKFCQELERQVWFELYYQFLKHVFPEVIEWSEKHETVDRGILFENAAEFDKKVKELIKKEYRRISDFRNKLESEIDAIYEYAVKLSTNQRRP